MIALTIFLAQPFKDGNFLSIRALLEGFLLSIFSLLNQQAIGSRLFSISVK